MTAVDALLALLLAALFSPLTSALPTDPMLLSGEPATRPIGLASTLLANDEATDDGVDDEEAVDDDDEPTAPPLALPLPIGEFADATTTEAVDSNGLQAS